MKILNIVIALIFAMFAAAQYNDPDGLTWVMIYGVIAVLAGFVAAGRSYPDLALGAMILIGGTALLKLPGAIEFFANDDGIGFSQGMDNTYPYIEEMREFFGLLLATAALYGTYAGSRANAKASDNS